MGAFTWLSDNELEKYSKVIDKEVNELFQEVRELSNNRYYLSETHHEIKGFLCKPKKFTSYTMYAESGLPEVQILSFHIVDGVSSALGGYVLKSHIMAWMYVYINGCNNGK